MKSRRGRTKGFLGLSMDSSMSQGKRDGLSGAIEACCSCYYGYTRETKMMERKENMGTLLGSLPSVLAVEFLLDRGSVVTKEW